MRKIKCPLRLSFIFLIAGLWSLSLAGAPDWAPWSATPALAHEGSGGGGENPNSLRARPKSSGKSRNDKLELPLPGEVRELGNLIVRGAAALREANGNIDFLNQLEREVEKMDDLSDARLREVIRDIRNARKEQERSRDEVRLGMKEAFAAIGVHLGNRNARAALREVDKAREQAAQLERNKVIVKLGKDGLTMIDNARALNSLANEVKSAFGKALSFFN